jgi:hypothetical protein
MMVGTLPVLASFLLVARLPAETPAIPPAGVLADKETGKKIFEEWSVLVLDGHRCGFDSTLVTEINTPAGPTYQTVEEQEFVVRRMKSNMKITDTSKVVEDADGGVLSYDEINAGAGSNIESSGHREGDDLVAFSRGQTARYHVPRLAALGPETVRRLSDALPLKAGQTFSFATFETDYPQAPVVEKGTVVGREARTINGVARQVWRISSDSSIMPGYRSSSWVDDAGNDVESIMFIPGIGHLDELVTDRADCMKQPEGAEIFAASLIHPQRALPDPKRQAQAFYRITAGPAHGKTPLWNEGEQRVLSSGPGTSDIVVTASRITPADARWQLPHPDTPELHPYLQPTAYLEVNSPEIQALARQAVGTEKNPVRAAHDIERFVRAYIVKKDLNIGFASAEETAQSREGDCTEHAVLCAALGRAAGLPTRCVLGFGYIPPGVDEPTIANEVGPDTGVFGFHMWAEAWIAPDKWVAMDAALDGFDVGHIAITKTALEEINPLVDLNLPILQLMENLHIRILKTVPKTAAPPDID